MRGFGVRFWLRLWLALWLTVPLLHASEPPILQLEMRLRSGDSRGLAGLFVDGSHTLLSGFCRDAVDLRLEKAVRDGSVTGFIKFPRHAEVIRLSFQTREGRFKDMRLTRVLFPMDYIRAFKVIDLDDTVLARGDATVRLFSGQSLAAEPFARLLLFTGSGEFAVAPQDPEEKLTLERISRSPRFNKAFAGLVFLRDEAPDAVVPGRSSRLDERTLEAGRLPVAVRELLQRFNRQFGIFIPGFDEYWYPRFSGRLNLMLLAGEKNARFHQYQYNPGFLPDTTLVEMPAHRYLLSYNRETGMKILQNVPDRVENLDLSLGLDPDARRLNATAQLRYEQANEFRQFLLNPRISVQAASVGGDQGVELFDSGGALRYLRGPPGDTFTLRYSGTISENRDALPPVRDDVFGDQWRNWDRFILWQRDTRFYPASEVADFHRTRVDVTVPVGFRCLVSGRRTSESELDGQRRLRFESPAAKGIGLVCGNFVSRLRVEAAVPVEVYAAADLVMRKKNMSGRIRAAIDFLLQAYGEPTSPLINLVLRRWHEYGGVSYQGLAVLNVPGARESRRKSPLRLGFGTSPVVITDIHYDSLVHELAHQWWGGEVSWRSYRDVWITEGLAQFSTLFFHKQRLPERVYAAAVRNMKRWVMRYSDAGPPVYGPRITNLGGDLNALHSVVYNRSALAFAMLTEILGEKEVFARLRSLLRDQRYRNLNTAQFISAFSRDNPRLKRFFKTWVLSRNLPRLHAATRFSGNTAEVDLTQETDAVFPLYVEVTTADGVSTYPLVMEGERLRRKWLENSPVRKVEIKLLHAPVVLRRGPE